MPRIKESMQSNRFLSHKQAKMAKLKKARRVQALKVHDPQAYLKLANAIYGEERIESRTKIIMKGRGHHEQGKED